METIFFFLFCIIVIIAGIRDNNHKSRTSHPYRESYSRNTDQKYLERLFILDFAEHGMFVPGAERVYDEPDESDDEYYEEYSDDYDDYSCYENEIDSEKNFYESYSYYEYPVDETWTLNDDSY